MLIACFSETPEDYTDRARTAADDMFFNTDHAPSTDSNEEASPNSRDTTPTASEDDDDVYSTHNRKSGSASRRFQKTVDDVDVSGSEDDSQTEAIHKSTAKRSRKLSTRSSESAPRPKKKQKIVNKRTRRR